MDNTVRTNEPLVDLKTEVIGGTVYMMAPPFDWHHSVVIGNLYAAIKARLQKKCKVILDGVAVKSTLDLPGSRNNDKKKFDYVIPDLMILCDTRLIKNGYYQGVPPFVVEVMSKNSRKRDRSEKLRIYEALGVREYWVVETNGIIDIYYLKNGEYELHDSVRLYDDKEEDSYNAKKKIKLRDFPDVRVRLGDIFDFGEE